MPLSSSDKTRPLPSPAILPLSGAHLGTRCHGLTAVQVSRGNLWHDAARNAAQGGQS